ncbi:MAG: hypothetical protein DRP79_08665, partial [Planctomycetota bacterium]
GGHLLVYSPVIDVNRPLVETVLQHIQQGMDILNVPLIRLVLDMRSSTSLQPHTIPPNTIIYDAHSAEALSHGEDMYTPLHEVGHVKSFGMGLPLVITDRANNTNWALHPDEVLHHIDAPLREGLRPHILDGTATSVIPEVVADLLVTRHPEFWNAFLDWACREWDCRPTVVKTPQEEFHRACGDMRLLVTLQQVATPLPPTLRSVPHLLHGHRQSSHLVQRVYEALRPLSLFLTAETVLNTTIALARIFANHIL